MSNKENKNSKNNPNKAEEPETAYQVEHKKKKITISSLKELEELNRTHTANLNPVQRMEYLRKLNENVFGFDLSRQKAVLRKGEVVIREES